MVGLEQLWVARYAITIRAREPIALPVMRRGVALRGAYAMSYRRLVCHDLALECRECPLLASCPYPEVFEPSPPPGAHRLSLARDLPRPFVMHWLHDEPLLPAGERGALLLTVVGRSARLLPYFALALRAVGDEGIGPARGRFHVEEIAAIDARGDRLEVFSADDSTLRPAAPPVRATDLVRDGDDARRSIAIRFVTPTELKHEGRVVASPRFGVIARRLRDRLNALSSFFADGPLDLDFSAIGDRADTVDLVRDETKVVSVPRRSGRTGERHDVGGFVGRATYEGDAIAGLMPLLRMGELLHVGRHAAFGNGRYVIE